MNRRVMVVVAHPDDESLGCGGAIARHVSLGESVSVVHLTDGVGARGKSPDNSAARGRSRCAAQAAKALGFEWVAAGDFPDNAIDSVARLDLIKFLEEVAQSVEPDVVYTHHSGDLNIDHRRAFEAVLTVFRPLPNRKPVELRTFEVPSSTEWSSGGCGEHFQPNLYIDISSVWNRKLEAVRAYHKEMRSAPHPRSVEVLTALSRRRGSEAGLDQAEAFMTVRRVIS